LSSTMAIAQQLKASRQCIMQPLRGSLIDRH
jgi:hypothetical protein